MADPTDPTVEARLERHGVTWTLDADYDLSLIDRKRSAAEAVRDLDADTVDRYVADVSAGDPFPPIVLRRLRKRSVVLGGAHRLAALDRLERDTHPAYVVDCSDDDALLLALDDNRTHGRTLTAEEKRQWALRLVDGGHTQADAARIVGVSQTTVSAAVRARRIRQVLVDADIGAEHLPTSTLKRLSSLPDDDEVIVSVGKAVTSGWLTSPALNKLVPRVNTAEPDERLDLIDAVVVDEMERQGARRRSGRQTTTAMSDDLVRLVRLGREICDVPRARLSGTQRGVDEARDVMRAVARWMLACDEAMEVRDR